MTTILHFDKTTDAAKADSGRRRQQKLRDKRKSAGMRPLTVYLTAESYDLVTGYKKTRGLTNDSAINELIQTGAKKNES